MSIHSPWCLRARAVFWGIFPIPAPPFVNAGRTADTAEHEQMMGEGKNGRRAGENNMRRWLAKDEEMSQGSNKFRDKRRTDRVNGQSKATDEVESDCQGQQRRVRQRKRRVGWWWKEKKEHTETPRRMTLHLPVSNVLSNNTCLFSSLYNSAFELKSGGGSYTRNGPRRRCAAGAEPCELSISPGTLDSPLKTKREPHLHAALQKQRF